MELVLALALAVMGTSIAQADERCPVSVVAPEGWHSKHTRVQEGVCQVDLSPSDWSQQIAKSRWAEKEFAIRLTIFSIAYEKAASFMGFERANDGRYYIEGRGSERDYAKKVSVGDLAGIRSEPWFRGFVKIEREGDVPEEERIYSGTRIVMLLRAKSGLLVGVEFNQWSPDITLDRESAAVGILKTVKAEPNKAL